VDGEIEARNGKDLFGSSSSMISVVIPNYNGVELLRRNLPRILELLQKSKLDFEVVVVDDASTDESIKYLKSQIENRKSKSEILNFRLVEKSVNEGFPISADQGIRAAKGEFVFVIKNDCVPENEKYFSLMLKHFDDPPSFAKASAGKEVFAVSGALETTENGGMEIRGNGQIYFEKGLFKHRRGDNGNKASAWADGGSSVFNRAIYLKIGGFDPVFRPGYWEDVDLGYRAWKAGYSIEFEPKAVLIHDYESWVYKKKYGEEKIKLINLRNQIIFTLKNSNRKNLMEFFKWEIYNHAAFMKSGNFDFVKANLLAMERLPEIIESRINQKKINQLTDSEVLRF
jgi:GT2 family glycosyltransferase